MELQYSTRDLARAAVIAAAYAALAWISNFFGLAFPAIQFRLSEALCVLPCRDRKAAIPGLAVGCLITNLLSPYGLLDLVVGTLATLLAAVWSGRCRSAWTAAVPPVVCNMVLVGAMLAWESTGFSAAFAGLFAYNALTVGIGEAAVCFLLGVPLLRALEKRGALVLDCDAVYHEMLRTSCKNVLKCAKLKRIYAPLSFGAGRKRGRYPWNRNDSISPRPFTTRRTSCTSATPTARWRPTRWRATSA